MMKDGECVHSGYPLDLDALTEGSRVGEDYYVLLQISAGIRMF